MTNKKILEQIAKEIGSDAWNLTKKVGEITKTTAKGALYLATAPVIGMLNEGTKKRIYKNNDGLEWGAQFLSLLPPVAIYISITRTLTKEENALFLALGVGALEYTVRGLTFLASSEDSLNARGTIAGYLPSKSIDYFFKKYDQAKEKIIEGESK